MKKILSITILLSLIVFITSCISSGNTQEKQKIKSDHIISHPDEIVEKEIIPINYSFHDTIEILPKGTNGTAGKNATYVYFGDWPKTIKSKNIVVNEDEKEVHGAFTYYKGSDGYWYVKCIEKKYKWAENLTYSDGSSVSDEIKYFKVEPIKWCILTGNYNESNKALLLSEDILFAEAYYDNYINEMYRSVDGKDIYPSNYKESRIRAYLNGYSYITIDVSKENPKQELNLDFENKGFLQTAFSNNAQSLIAISKIDNSDASNIHYPAERIPIWNTYRDDYWCEDTYDKVFLLSEKEVTEGAFKFGRLDQYGIREVRIINPTDFAKANNAYEYFSWDGNVFSFWWLRTPMNGDWRLVRFVAYQGCSADNMSLTDSCGGIVPAICVSINEK